MTVIRAEHYDEIENWLTEDLIVQAMAKGLAGVPRAEMVHDDGTPRFEFMLAANHEYEKRSAHNSATHDQITGAHLGAVAYALLKLLGA